MERPIIYVSGLPALHYGKTHISVVASRNRYQCLTLSISLEHGVGV